MSNCCSVHGKVKPKPLSFQEFNSKTSDAWGEDDDDAIKVDHGEKKNVPSQPRVRTISGGDVRASIPTVGIEPKKLPEQLQLMKEEHKTSRPSPISLLSKECTYNVYIIIVTAFCRALFVLMFFAQNSDPLCGALTDEQSYIYFSVGYLREKEYRGM